MATLLVLSGAAAALSPIQAFADEGKKKDDDKKKKHHDDDDDKKKHDDKKKDDDKQNEHLRAYIDSVIAGTQAEI